MLWYEFIPRRFRRSSVGQWAKRKMKLLTIDEIAYGFGVPAQRLDFLIRMKGEFPDRESLDRLTEELEKNPAPLRDPLSTYLHRYDNGNPAASPAAKKLIFLHMQYSGGETITRIMQANVRSIGMRRDLSGLPTLPPHFFLSCFRDLPPIRQREERDKWSAYDVLAEHGIYGLHEMLHPPYGYFTLLRHPLNRLIEYCRYLDSERAKTGGGSRTIKAHLEDEEFQRDILLGKSYAQKFSGYPLVGNFLLRLKSRSVVERAKRKLASFDLVLIAEAFDESVQLLCKTYGWQDAFYEDGRIVPRDGRLHEPWTTRIDYEKELTAEERMLAETLLQEDIEIYEWGKTLFDAKLAGKPLPVLTRERMADETPTDLYRTRIGQVHISARWAQLAKRDGLEPGTLEIRLREAYYGKRLEGPALMDYAVSTLGIQRDIARMWLETNHAEHIATEVIEHDSYRLEALKKSGFQPKTILDVGGHVGTFSLLAHHVWPEAKIVTIEPLTDDRIDPNNCKVLRLNVSGILQITVVNAALIGFLGADHEDNDRRIVELLADPNHEHWLELGLRGYEKNVKTIKRSKMRGISVASLLEETGITSIDLLKIDCEGSETNALREFHALGMMPKIDRIVGEWHGNVARDAIPALLRDSHELEFLSVPPLHKSGIFRAVRRTLLIPPL